MMAEERNRRPEIIMMCGPCGARKTTYAKQKEKDGYIRLSIDEEIWKRWGQYGLDYRADQYEILSARAERHLRRRLSELIAQKQNVILDFSFWNRDRRAAYRKEIEEAGGQVTLIYMKADQALLRKRLQKRNQTITANSAFAITNERLSQYLRSFQEPQGEGEIVIDQNALEKSK